MDYIIKEKTFLERLLDCEFNNYLTDSKYITIYMYSKIHLDTSALKSHDLRDQLISYHSL